MSIIKPIARIGGNFGISFFSPLVGGNAAESIYDIGLSLVTAKSAEAMVVIEFISATLITGLSISREAHEWGKNGGKKRK